MFPWLAAGALAGGAVGFGAYGLTHRDNFSWGEAAAWAAGGAIVGGTLGAGAEVAAAYGVGAGAAAGGAAAAGGGGAGIPLVQRAINSGGAFTLQRITNTANARLAANPALARSVLHPNKYASGRRSAQIARMEYGNAVEGLVALRIEGSFVLSRMFRHIGGPNQPDFVGRGLLRGQNYDITTPGHAAAHFGRWYGPGLNIIPYERPPGFTVFP